MAVNTACSGSLISLDVASRYFDSEQARGMIVAEANIWLNPKHNEKIEMMRATQSASEKCHTFDAKADDYVKAETINALILKRPSYAIHDGNPVWALVRRILTNNGGSTPGLASPSAIFAEIWKRLLLRQDDENILEAKLKLLVFSANDEDPLKSNIKSLSAHLIHPDVFVDITDLAYTLAQRRSHHHHHAFIVTGKSNSNKSKLYSMKG